MFQRAPPDVNGLGVMTETPVLEQVIPGVDVLGVALAHDEDDHAVRDHALVLVRVPIGRDDARA